jgi:hypothetical protein
MSFMAQPSRKRKHECSRDTSSTTTNHDKEDKQHIICQPKPKKHKKDHANVLKNVNWQQQFFKLATSSSSTSLGQTSNCEPQVIKPTSNNQQKQLQHAKDKDGVTFYLKCSYDHKMEKYIYVPIKLRMTHPVRKLNTKILMCVIQEDIMEPNIGIFWKKGWYINLHCQHKTGWYGFCDENAQPVTIQTGRGKNRFIESKNEIPSYNKTLCIFLELCFKTNVIYNEYLHYYHLEPNYSSLFLNYHIWKNICFSMLFV